MAKKIVESKVKCPKCKSGNNITLSEFWRESSITWQQVDGKFDRNDGNVNPDGDPYKVEALCRCGHHWRVKGAIQITDVIKEEQ